METVAMALVVIGTSAIAEVGLQNIICTYKIWNRTENSRVKEGFIMCGGDRDEYPHTKYTKNIISYRNSTCNINNYWRMSEGSNVHLKQYNNGLVNCSVDISFSYYGLDLLFQRVYTPPDPA